MVLSNQEKTTAFRKRKAAAGKKELRGVWVTNEEEKLIKAKIKELLNRN